MQFLLIIVCGLSSLLGCSQNNSPAMQETIDKDMKETKAVVQQLVQLMIARNTTAMSKILDNDFTLTHT